MTAGIQKPVAVITGGTGYVGSAIASALIERDWLPVLLSLESRTLEGAETIVCDITDEKDVEKMTDVVVKKYGTVAACIHTAATPIARVSLLEDTIESFEKTVAVSVRGAFLLARAMTPYMESCAAFIGITTQAIEPTATVAPKIGAYIPSKMALRGFLRVLAHEAEGLRIYAVAPGFLPGGLNRDLPTPVRTLLARQPDGTTSSANDVAEIVADICANASLFPSGTSILSPSRAVTPL